MLRKSEFIYAFFYVNTVDFKTSREVLTRQEVIVSVLGFENSLINEIIFMSYWRYLKLISGRCCNYSNEIFCSFRRSGLYERKRVDKVFDKLFGIRPKLSFIKRAIFATLILWLSVRRFILNKSFCEAFQTWTPFYWYHHEISDDNRIETLHIIGSTLYSYWIKEGQSISRDGRFHLKHHSWMLRALLALEEVACERDEKSQEQARTNEIPHVTRITLEVAYNTTMEHDEPDGF